MAEHQHGDHRDQPLKSSEDKSTDRLENDADIIELSDIAIGTTPEDDAIVELTEEVIDEAMVGISGATRDSFKEGEEFLDLSKTEPEKESRFKEFERGSEDEKRFTKTDGGVLSDDMALDDEEDHISKELDDFFGAEEESLSVEKKLSSVSAQPLPEAEKTEPAIAESSLVEAIELAIRKMYGDRINKLMAEVIEKIVRDEINHIKEILSGKTQK
jgi:hypothetical protein